MINKDELRKSLVDLEFSPEEIEGILAKAEKDDIEKGEKDKEAEVTDEGGEKKTVDEEKQENPDKEEMQKSCDKIMKMKDELDKSMTDFLNKYGNAPGIKTPDSDLGKSIENDIEKSFGDKFGEIEKSIEKSLVTQNEINNQLLKSLEGISNTVNAIAESPNPLKGLFGSYRNSILEKGGKDSEGKTVLSLSRNKQQVQEEIEKSLSLISDESDKQIVRNMLSDYTISNKVSPMGLDIVTKAINIDFEK